MFRSIHVPTFSVRVSHRLGPNMYGQSNVTSIGITRFVLLTAIYYSLIDFDKGPNTSRNPTAGSLVPQSAWAVPEGFESH